MLCPNRRRLSHTPGRQVNRPLTLGVSLVLFLVLMALGCELTLSWNGLTDIYSLNSTGQLVPLMVGGVRAREQPVGCTRLAGWPHGFPFAPTTHPTSPSVTPRPASAL